VNGSVIVGIHLTAVAVHLSTSILRIRDGVDVDTIVNTQSVAGDPMAHAARGTRNRRGGSRRHGERGREREADTHTREENERQSEWREREAETETVRGDREGEETEACVSAG
jgi:hypothetical protein